MLINPSADSSAEGLCWCTNLKQAYKAYLVLEEKEADEKSEEILEHCDDIFYENEEEINRALEDYASKMEL